LCGSQLYSCTIHCPRLSGLCTLSKCTVYVNTMVRTLRIMYLLCKRYALFHLCFVQLCCVDIRVRFYVSDQMLHGQQNHPLLHCGFILTYTSQNHISPVSHEIYSWGYILHVLKKGLNKELNNLLFWKEWFFLYFSYIIMP